MKLLDDLDLELLAKIEAEVIKKLESSISLRDKKEYKFSDCIANRNSRTYNSKKDPVIVEEWITQMEKIFDVIEVPNHKRITIWAFDLTEQANIW